MPKILLAFAMKDEFAPWRRRHRFNLHSFNALPTWTARVGNTEVYAALVGAGAPDGGAFRQLAAQLSPDAILVTGVAAGLKPEWRPGDLLVARSVTNPDASVTVACDASLVQLAEKLGAKPAPTLVTLPRVVRTVEEKRQLASRGDAADMESLLLIKDSDIPTLALRVILDPVEMRLTCDFESAMDAHGQIRISGILGQLARHPQLLPDFIHLARHSHKVLNKLSDFLDRFVASFPLR